MAAPYPEIPLVNRHPQNTPPAHSVLFVPAWGALRLPLLAVIVVVLIHHENAQWLFAVGLSFDQWDFWRRVKE